MNRSRTKCSEYYFSAYSSHFRENGVTQRTKKPCYKNQYQRYSNTTSSTILAYLLLIFIHTSSMHSKHKIMTSYSKLTEKNVKVPFVCVHSNSRSTTLKKNHIYILYEVGSLHTTLHVCHEYIRLHFHFTPSFHRHPPV